MLHAYNPSYSGGWGRTAWTQETEVAVSKIASLHSSLGNKSEIPSQKKKKKKEENSIIKGGVCVCVFPTSPIG